MDVGGMDAGGLGADAGDSAYVAVSVGGGSGAEGWHGDRDGASSSSSSNSHDRDTDGNFDGNSSNAPTGDVGLVVELLDHGFTKEELLTSDWGELRTQMYPTIVANHGEELTDADMSAGDLADYIRTDLEVATVLRMQAEQAAKEKAAAAAAYVKEYGKGVE
jgi:hypothetical protein